MSQFQFNARLHVCDQQPASEWVTHYVSYCTSSQASERQAALAKLVDLYPSSNFVTESRWDSFSVSSDEAGVVSISAEAPLSQSLDYFEQFGEALESLAIDQYSVKLFDSSSGGVQFWEKPSVEISFDGKNVLILGDVDDQEDLIDALEEEGATLVERFDGVDIVIIAENLSPQEASFLNAFAGLVVSGDDARDHLDSFLM